MYRILVIIVLLGHCDPAPKRLSPWNKTLTPCLPRSSKQQDKHEYDSITTLLGEVEAKLREVCSHFPNVRVKDVYTDDKFIFEVNLAEFEGYNDFDVRIKHRTMCIVGHIPRKHPQCDLSYVSITVLPEFLNFHGASWTYYNNNLVVSIPYKYNIADEVDQHCYDDVDETLIFVRRDE